MKNKDKIKWFEKNTKTNCNIELLLGMTVIDSDNNEGVVVSISKPEQTDDHGSVFVWQSKRTGYGIDNCEHYCYTNWKTLLRIIN